MSTDTLSGINTTEVREWADTQLNTADIGFARIVYRVLTERRYEGRLTDEESETISALTMECEALLKQGQLDRALVVARMLEERTAKVKLPAWGKIYSMRFKDCAKANIEKGDYRTALRALLIADCGSDLREFIVQCANRTKALALSDTPDPLEIAELMDIITEADVGARAAAQRLYDAFPPSDRDDD